MPWVEDDAPAQQPPQAAQPQGHWVEDDATQSAPVAKGSLMKDLTNPDPTTYYPKGLPIPMVKEASGARRFGAPALVQDIYRAVTAPGRSFSDPNFDPMGEARNMATLIAGAPVAKGAAPVAREMAGDAATVLKEASPLELAPKQAPAPTRNDIRNQSTQAYKTATDAGIIVAPQPFKNFADEAATALKQSGLNDRLHPNVAAALDDIKAAAASGKPQTLQEIEILRRVANSAVKGAVNDDQASKAGTLVRSIDGFIDNLGPEHLVEGDADVAVPALKTARSLWAKNAKMGDIEDIADTAARQDDPAKYIKQQFTRITKDSDKFDRYTKGEQALILDLAKTGKVETLGKLAPSLDLVGVAKGGLYAGASLANPAMLALPAVGFAAKHLANQSRRSNLQSLEDLIARGSPEQKLMGRVQRKPGLLGSSQRPGLLD